MAVRAINTASDAEIATCVANWNAQAAQLNTPDRKAFDVWGKDAANGGNTAAQDARLLLSQASAHRIDTLTNNFVVSTFDPELNQYDFVAYINGLLGVARCMRALCQLLPGTAIVRGDVITGLDRAGRGTLVSQTIRNYYQTRYTANPHPRLEGITRFTSTAANIVSRA